MQQGSRRSLWFDDVILQSEIDVDDPQVLPNPVNQAMLAHLLFGQEPRRVLLGGCGGGAIARWLHARAPGCQGDAVELHEAIAQVAREWFDFPKPSTGWQIRLGDLRDFVASSNKRYDFILIDLEQQHFTPPWVTEIEFLQHCRARLSTQGVLTLNLICKNTTQYRQALQRVREVFEQRTLSLPIAGHDNQFILAFRNTPKLDEMPARVSQAAQRWGLPLKRFWKILREHNPPGSGVI